MGRAPRVRASSLHALAHETVELGLGRLVLDGAGKMRADLLHHLHARAALADLLAVDPRRDRARRAEHRDEVGVELRGYCGVVTAHGVCVAASTVGATMPSTS